MKASDQPSPSLSNRPLDARLREWSAFLRTLIRPVLFWLIFMSLMRFLTWWLSPPEAVAASGEEIAMAFGAGLRFDLLVTGFLLIPVVIFGALTFALGWGLRAGMAIRRYLSVVWLVVVVLAFVDAIFFSLRARRLSFEDLQGGVGFLESGLRAQGAATFWMTAAIFFCLWLVGSRAIFASAPEPIEVELESSWKKAGRIALPLVVVALMARGTVTAHHLDRRHAEVSRNPAINELALNAIWALDKKPNIP